MKSFAEVYPSLVSEWSETNLLGPDKVSYGSKKPIVWNGKCGHIWTALPKERGRGSGCPYCASKKVLVGFNDLASRCPELAKEWSPENAQRADGVIYGSHKSYLWIGSCGHSWTTSIKNRVNGHGCPYCSTNKILIGFNDLASQFPNIAKEWSDRNYPASPNAYGAHSNHNFWWKCSKCGREWQARIADRTDGHGCPHCLKDSIAERTEQRKATHKQEVLYRLRERQFARSLKRELFRRKSLSYYAEQIGIQVEYDYDPGIGIPVQLYLPEKYAAIELTPNLNEGWMNWRYENAKNWLCLNSGIKLVRIIPQTGYNFENCKCVRVKNGTAEALNYALTQAFKKLKIPMDIDVSRDFEKIRRIEI